jgi:hypothetical protein
MTVVVDGQAEVELWRRAVAGAGAMIAVHAGAARGDRLHLGRQTPVGDARTPVPLATVPARSEHDASELLECWQ